MGLDKGTRLGPYEIATPLGAGGMGEVYRAHDTRLGREVAIKVLRPDAVHVTGRRERFVQEARAISALQHPHICVLHDVGCEDGTDFLVMEYLEGETLAQRLAKGPLPLPELLRTGSEIAGALDKAHRHGILHRDLKPANIMLTKAGAKLMDFGLAKTTAHVTASLASLTQPLEGPTAPVTAEGTLIGTYPYMAPEQLEGNPADARSDIFALGAVLYEMASGQQAFAGKTRASVMAAILERQPPPLSSLQPLTPLALERTVQGCLAKDPEERFQSAHDVKLQLGWIGDTGSQAGAPALAAARRRSRQPLVWAAAAAVLLAAGTFAAGHYLQTLPAAPVVMSKILPPPGTQFTVAGIQAGPPVIAPDGRRLAFVTTDSAGTGQLWVRPLDSAVAQPLANTEGAQGAFWSPDSRYLAFFTPSGLNQVAASGGAALTVVSPYGAGFFGAAWGQDGTILRSLTPISPIFREPASGGQPYQLTQLDKARSETYHHWPQFLPDGRHFLYYAFSSSPGDAGTYAGSLDGGAPKLVIHGDSDAVYAAPGYLLFVNHGTLMAQPFDPGRLRLSGDAMPVAQDVAFEPGLRHEGLFTVSQNGVLVYETGAIPSGAERIVWFDRAGKQIGEIGAPGSYGAISLSPDGGKLAVSVTNADDGKPDVWVFDLPRAVWTRLTLAPGVNADPAWSPDGKSIAFLSSRTGPMHLYQMAADGTGNATPVVIGDLQEYLFAWTADARHLFFQRSAPVPGARSEIWEVPLGGDKKPQPVLQDSRVDFTQPAPSPDGKWLAYVSQDTGSPQVFIVPFPHGNGRWQVSTDGGVWPKWRRDGAELFYRSLDSKVMSASIEERGGHLVVGKALPLFQADFPKGALGAAYDVSPDGKRFLAVTHAPPPALAPLTLVTNWPALLKKP